MDPEKKWVSGRVRVEPTRPEPDPKTRIFSGNPTLTWPENPNISGLPDLNPTRKPEISGLPDSNLTRNPIFSGFLKIFK